jgi:GR25 family glycosyltransferase involved in LPS biosynthesis
MADSIGMKFTRIPAVDKNNLMLSTGQNMEENDRRQAELACKLSHITAISQAKALGAERVLIFEDDAELSSNFLDQLDRAYNDLPSDWEMFYLGVNDINKTKQIYNNHLCKIFTGYTTHAYSVNIRAYDLILNKLLYRAPIDVLYAEFIHPRGHSYCMHKNICSQIDDFSDITNKHESYQQLKHQL